MRINLKGELVSDADAELLQMFGYSIGYYSPSNVRSAVESLEDGEVLELDINSIGGLCDGAAEIYALIQQAKSAGHQTIARIQSLAASAASYMILACDRIEMALPAQMMIHCASMAGYGNKFNFKHAAKELDEQDQALLDVYALRCGEKADRGELERMMNAETWLRASRCLELGLVDAIIGRGGINPQNDGMVASADNIVRSMSALPDMKELRERRNAADSWQVDADAELENERRRFE